MWGGAWTWPPMPLLKPSRSASRPRPQFREAEAPLFSRSSLPRGLGDLAAARPEVASRVRMSHYTVQNSPPRHGNEDRWLEYDDVMPSGSVPFHIVGVLDGHDTDEASELVSRRLPGMVARALKEGEATDEAYAEALAELESTLKSSGTTAGTCVLSCLIAGPFIWCANLGDCRAVYVPLHVPGQGEASSKGPKGEVCLLSKDQKASSPHELERIRKLGGSVERGRIEGLEPSRTLGDFDVKCRVPPGVVSIVPEIRTYQVGADSDLPAQGLLICATDGVWDILTSRDVLSMVTARGRDLAKLQALVDAAPQGADLDDDVLREICQDLVQFSVAKGSEDDCTSTVALISVTAQRPAAARRSRG